MKVLHHHGFFAQWNPIASIIVIMIYPNSLKTSMYFVTKTLYHTQGNYKYTFWHRILFKLYKNKHSFVVLKMVLFSLFIKVMQHLKSTCRVLFKTDFTLNFSCEVETDFFFLQWVLVFYCYVASCHKLSSLKQYEFISSQFYSSEVW